MEQQRAAEERMQALQQELQRREEDLRRQQAALDHERWAADGWENSLVLMLSGSFLARMRSCPCVKVVALVVGGGPVIGRARAPS